MLNNYFVLYILNERENLTSYKEATQEKRIVIGYALEYIIDKFKKGKFDLEKFKDNFIYDEKWNYGDDDEIEKHIKTYSNLNGIEFFYKIAIEDYDENNDLLVAFYNMYTTNNDKIFIKNINVKI